MFREKEKRFFIGLIIAGFILVFFAIASVVIFSFDLAYKGNVSECFFEIICFFVYLVLIVFALIVSFMAYNKGSTIIKPLMYLRNNTKVVSKRAVVISIVFFAINFPVFIYTLLHIIMPEAIPLFHFSTVLSYLVCDSTLMISVFAAAFFLYPKIVNNKSNKQD